MEGQSTGSRFVELSTMFHCSIAEGYDACINQARWQRIISEALAAGWNIEQAKRIAGRAVYVYSDL